MHTEEWRSHLLGFYQVLEERRLLGLRDGTKCQPDETIVWSIVKVF
jgi:hypothetical protein